MNRLVLTTKENITKSHEMAPITEIPTHSGENHRVDEKLIITQWERIKI
jgi:hypothetical protein